MENGVAIPTVAGDITPEWLTKALRSGNTLKVASVRSLSVEPLGDDIGFSGGSLLLLTPQYDLREDGAPVTLVAKLAPIDPDLRRVYSPFNRGEVKLYIEFSRQEELAPLCATSAIMIPQLA